MTTFDLATVRGFAADLDSQLDRCDNGEGWGCSGLDAILRHYADSCRRLLLQVREWGQAVFTGREGFRPEVESEWKTRCERLHDRADAKRREAVAKEGGCYFFDGYASLQAALGDLRQLLDGWVTPKLAAGPAARRTAPVAPAVVEEARRRADALPPLPTGWQPAGRVG